jgi:hypothetical protein
LAYGDNFGVHRGDDAFDSGDSLQLGGSGIDVKKRLPEEIEALLPDYDWYPYRAIVWRTTRMPLSFLRKFGVMNKPQA